MIASQDVPFPVNGDEPPMRRELKISEERMSKNGKWEVSVIRDLGGSKASDETYVVEVHYLFNDKHRLEKTKVTINSPRILKILARVVVSHPTVATDLSEPFTMETPFQMLIHYWDELFQYRDTVQDDEDRMHLNVLLEFMSIDLGQNKAELDKAVAAGQVKYSTLWTLFRPRDLVVLSLRGHPWVLKISKTAYEESQQIGPYLEVHCTYTDCDGTDVGMAPYVAQIVQKRSFGQEDPANIVDLPLYPRKFYAEGEALERRLLERGNRFLQYRDICVRYYEGQADYLREYSPDYFHPEMDQFGLIWLPVEECGRVIIDRKTFQEDYHPAILQHSTLKHKIDPLLCPPFVYGYSLGQKEWCRLYVDRLHDPGWKKNAFDAVILPKHKLDLIRALVGSHRSPSRPRDQMKQKGKGLVILLHGNPGTGKTLTAECAAEETQRGLLSTTLPELNKYKSVSSFERRLKSILQLATTWNAVVLFDEADVFLQSNEDGSAIGEASNRSTLVAVFLRNLEYFSGIAILTTNRVRAFDGAMKSRIHLAMRYPDPDAASRTRIWSNALFLVPSDECDLDIDDAAQLWAKEDFNGRQIANAVHTAHSLARFSQAKLARSHVDSIIQMWKELESELRPKASTGGIGARGTVRRESNLDEGLGL